MACLLQTNSGIAVRRTEKERNGEDWSASAITTSCCQIVSQDQRLLRGTRSPKAGPGTDTRRSERNEFGRTVGLGQINFNLQRGSTKQWIKRARHPEQTSERCICRRKPPSFCFECILPSYPHRKHISIKCLMAAAAATAAPSLAGGATGGSVGARTLCVGLEVLRTSCATALATGCRLARFMFLHSICCMASRTSSLLRSATRFGCRLDDFAFAALSLQFSMSVASRRLPEVVAGRRPRASRTGRRLPEVVAGRRGPDGAAGRRRNAPRADRRSPEGVAGLGRASAVDRGLSSYNAPVRPPTRFCRLRWRLVS